MPRATKAPGKSRHDPLLAQLDEDEHQAKYGRISQPGKREKSSKKSVQEDDNAEVILDPKTSRRIFELAKIQQDELDALDDDDDEGSEEESPDEHHSARNVHDEDNEVDSEPDEELEEIEEIFEIDAGDMQTLDTLLPHNSGERKTLADIIFAKLDSSGNAAVIQKVAQRDPSKPDPALGLDPKVVEAYTKLGLFLQKYKSGPLPKLFKVIPSLPAWARILALTEPENWSPHACRAATKIFISTMKPPQAQLFLSVVLLDAVREDIREHKKLNVQYYEALKRSLYKPGAFFKGIVFPMLDQGCSLKEAAIIASILAKVKLPVLHASAALMRIAEMDYTGPNSLFIRVLIDKKFELPYKPEIAGSPTVFQSYGIRVCSFFLSGEYGSDLTPDQKDALLDVARATPHAQISPEIRRELVNSVVRGAPREGPDGDVEMA
ncbi:hypothetical protein D9757_000408 [Collybiopsis confluens]|uniref:Bystin n=1 Tax=Collybiopsis confluens TaxID=2823264 RepID=A0A8H5I251_9AGAR|nr:hypothetical protein D9757_000408 [Collybiopsis confluens]